MLLASHLARPRMRPIAEKTTRLSVSVGQSDHDALEQFAEQNDVSVSWLVRKAIERFLASDPQGDLFPSTQVQEVTRK
jgi:Ribbon-helix-helix protein, copG family